MKYIYIIIICLFSNCNSQNNNKINVLENPSKNDFSIEQIKALYFINKQENLDLNLFTKSFNAIDIDSLIPQYVGTNNFKKKISKINSNQKEILLKKSNQWIQIKNVLDFAIDNSEDVDYLEFFYNNFRTRKIFNFYLKSPNQDWGSLSASEQYEVYYQIINYIYLQKPNDKLIFISDFYNKMRNHVE